MYHSSSHSFHIVFIFIFIYFIIFLTSKNMWATPPDLSNLTKFEKQTKSFEMRANFELNDSDLNM